MLPTLYKRFYSNTCQHGWVCLLACVQATHTLLLSRSLRVLCRVLEFNYYSESDLDYK